MARAAGPQKGELGIVLEKLMKSSIADEQGWIVSDRVLSELEAHRSGRRDNHMRLWLILWLELWFRIKEGRMDRDANLSALVDRCEF